MRILFAILALASSAWAAGVWKTDIEFSRPGGVSLTLDAWVPEGKGRFPAVIVVHGGGFEHGDKQTFVQPLFEPLRNSGFAWFTINYRLSPKYPFPACMDDTFAAIEWVKKHAKEYKVDPNKIALMGESAGGVIVSYVGARGHGKTKVAAVVDFYGRHDWLYNARKNGLSDSDKHFIEIQQLDSFGERKLGEVSSTTYVHKKMPPFLFIHGTQDKAVPYEQSPLMCQKMKSVGASCEVYTVDGAPHGVGPWEKNPAWQGYKTKMIDWLKETLK